MARIINWALLNNLWVEIRIFSCFMLRVVERLFLCDRTGSVRPVPRQSLRLVACAWQALRSVLIPIACESHSIPLAIAHEGQWKGMSFREDPKEIEKEQMHPDPFSGL